jgi:predicted amidohydrolase
MGVRIGLVQPLAHRPPADERNVAQAVELVGAAAGDGAQLVVLPETYPGPWRMPAGYDPTPQLTEAAARSGVYVLFGTLQPLDPHRRAHNVLVLAGPDGSVRATYRRTHPPGPWLYVGGDAWDFDYVAADGVVVADTEHGRLGLGMCSEVYVPEVSRAMALRGAEIILLPAGVDKGRLWATWRNLIWSRAIENLAVTVTTQNLFSAEERGLAMVAGPEEILFETVRPGVFTVDVDLTRVRALRGEWDDAASSQRNAAKAGVLTQWQRPELYARWLGAGEPAQTAR